MRRRGQDEQRFGSCRQKLGETAGLLSTCVNLFLALSKGVLAGCFGPQSLAADALNNLMDTVFSLACIWGFRLSGRAPSARFPHGFSRAPALLAFSVALWMLAMGVRGIGEALVLCLAPEAGTAAHGGILLFFSGVKLALAAYQRHAARRAGSALLALSAKDSVLDALSGLLVLLSTVLAQRGIFCDGYFSLALSALLLLAGWGGVAREFPVLVGRDGETFWKEASLESDDRGAQTGAGTKL